MSGIEGKVVIITGASRGLGAATVRELARRGAKVVLGSRSMEQLGALVAEVRRDGHTADFRQTNVVRIEELRYLAQYTAAKYGRIDALVNAAGIMPDASLARLEIDEWNRTIDVNLRGILHGVAAVLPYFEQQGSGHIVNLCSPVPSDAPNAGVYNGTQLAIRAISDSLRHEVGDGIRITLIEPEATEDLCARNAFEVSALLKPDAIARRIASALERPYEINLSKVAVRTEMIDTYRCC